MKTNLGKAGFIGRFKPLHNGGYVMLNSLCEKADEVIIGIGSSNKYNLRNPFTAEESEAMINCVLANKFSNYSIIHIPDFAHLKEYNNGQKWKNYIVEKFKGLDYFISSNEYVRTLLEDSFSLLYPFDIIPKEKYLKLRATEVRVEMAKFGNWKNLVPESVASYLEKNKLVDRFRREFGLKTIANLTYKANYKEDENKHTEKMHAQEV